MKSVSVVRALLFGAGLLLVAYAVCHLLGLREATGLVCRIDLQVAPRAGEIIGLVAYLASYAGAILVAPILLLAAGMIWLFDRLRARNAP
jgi:formate/nitrite transporter FocA (FNT family)